MISLPGLAGVSARLAAALALVLLLVAPAAAEMIPFGSASSSSGGVTGLTANNCATVNALLKMHASSANTADCTTWTEASGLLTSTTATGVGLGTATPLTQGSETFNTAVQVVGTTAAVLVSGSTSADWVLFDSNATANQRRLRGRVTGTTASIGRVSDDGATAVDYLTAALNTDAATLGSNSISGLTLNSGTAKLSHTLSSISPASAAGAVLDAFDIAAQTFVVTGATNITTATGFNLVNLGVPTYSAASALTITNAATLYIAGAPAGGGAGPATITNAYALWVDAGKARFDGMLALGGPGQAAIKNSGGDLYVRDADDGGFAPLWAATLKAGAGPTFVSNSTGTTLSNIYPLRWSSTAAADGVADLALYRNAAGVLEINDSNAGTFRDLITRSLGTGSALYAAAPIGTVGSGTGVTVNATGDYRRVVYKATFTYAAFSAAATTADKTIYTLAAKQQLQRIYADVTAVFDDGAGPISAATMTCGKTAGGNEYLVSFDVFTAAITRGLVDADLGTSINRANAIQGGDLPSWIATTAVQCRLTTTGGNTNTLTTGTLGMYLVTEML